MLDRPDAPVLAVVVQRRPTRGLAERDLGRNPGGAGHEEVLGFGRRRRPHDVPLVQRCGERGTNDGRHRRVDQPGPVELSENAEDAAGPVHVFDVVLVSRGCHLADVGHASRQRIDVGHREVEMRLLGGGQQVEHGVGRTAHRNVECHGVGEGRLRSNRSGQDRLVVLLVVAAGEIHDRAPGPQEELLTVGVGGNHRAVAGQGKAERFGQAVHRVGREHAGTRSTRRARRSLDGGHVLVAHRRVAGRHHRRDEIDLDLVARQPSLTGFHRSATDEHHRNVQPHRRVQHAGRDLVAIADTDHRIGAMGIDHVFDTVGNDLARGQGIEHPVMAHGDAVIHGNGVEFLGNTARRFDLARDKLAQILKVDMAGHELGKAVHDRDDRLAEIAVGHAGGAPLGAGAGHVATMGRCA